MRVMTGNVGMSIAAELTFILRRNAEDELGPRAAHGGIGESCIVFRTTTGHQIHPADMPRPIITLTTDFGSNSPYVAQMKGVILSICREVDLVDISHSVGAQNI